MQDVIAVLQDSTMKGGCDGFPGFLGLKNATFNKARIAVISAAKELIDSRAKQLEKSKSLKLYFCLSMHVWATRGIADYDRLKKVWFSEEYEKYRGDSDTLRVLWIQRMEKAMK